jgi:DNA-directed RNA polymerase specialized sigma24 family protein
MEMPFAPTIEPESKAIDLAVIKKGAKDFLTFVDDTKELFYAYLYHRIGSKSLSATVMTEIYLETLSRAMSLWWFGTLSLGLLIDRADRAIADGLKTSSADIDAQYLPSLTWLSEAEKASVATLHDSLWTLSARHQRLLTLSMLVGLSDERIGLQLGERTEQITKAIAEAKEALVARWQPVEELKAKLSSLVFAPDLDIAAESDLRFKTVEKYNALRFRRYQWVIVGGMVAVMSNMIVASVLAFAVITQPSTSLQSVKREMASLDAVLLQRKLESLEVRRSLNRSFDLTRGMAAQGALKDINDLGMATAADAASTQKKNDADVQRVIDLLQRVSSNSTAMILSPRPVMPQSVVTDVAMQFAAASVHALMNL